MNLKNIDKEIFIQIFGEEGLELIEGYDNDLFVFDRNGMKAFGTDENQVAYVVPFLYNGETEHKIIMVINYEVILESMHFIDRMFAPAVQKLMREKLVHERTHVQQFAEGRMVWDGVNNLWEGKPTHVYPTATSMGYYTSPWEVEAYTNEIAYRLNVSNEEALEVFKEWVETNVAKAA